MSSVAIVGAGFSGAVIANELANAGFLVDIFDSRAHVAGNCHTSRDTKTGVMLHVYGPHIFHTNDKEVWDYICQFDNFYPYINRVKAISNGKVYSLPINLMTINNFFGKALSPSEAFNFIEKISSKSIDSPETFEEQALKFVGSELYEAFFKGYTEKQWGIHPSKLPASILKRLPLRFNYDDNYYSSLFQGMPENGYTYIIQRMLDHKNIKLSLSTTFVRNQCSEYKHVFYSGPIDTWFDYSEGRLAYRTLDFTKETHIGDYQGNAVINYCDFQVPWTRITEHKHLSPWERHDNTVIYREFSRECQPDDIPYYPVRLINDKEMLSKYISIAEFEKNVTFVGRLGTYRYIDMHITIKEALEAAKLFVYNFNNKKKIPVFTVNPL
jgi:UDP-galactopyranose mutase